MRTYKDLQTATLSWMADPDDTGLLQTLVKSALNRAHQNLLNDDRYDFMLWPRTETLTTAIGTTNYALHPRFAHPYFVYNPTTNEYLEEIPIKGLMESGADWQDGTTDTPDRFMLTGISKVQTQPTTAAVVIITTTGGTESAANSFLVTGIRSGVVVTETLSSVSAWSTLTGSQLFDVIEDITKIGATWTRTCTATCNGQTLVAWAAADFGYQYRVLELLATPTSSSNLLYRFYRQPRELVLDNDIPDLPIGYDDILVYRALVDMQGYTRATAEEVSVWTHSITMLTNNLQSAFRSSRTMGGRPTYTRFIPRA